jgi:hypothetical protein
MRSIIRPADARVLIALVCTATLVTAIVINPLRETAFTDDWVYATMVRGFLDTGRFQMHPWAAADPWLLIVWGAICSKVFGFSFTTLRLSAMVLDAIGLVAFFLLCLEHHLDVRKASVLTLVLFASPLMVRHTFSFMSDVPFIAFCTLAVLFFTRALRTERFGLMLVGALFAAGAVLLRQFGAAFVPALGLVWLTNSGRLRRLWLILVGAVPPLAATVWQIHQGTRATAWTARLRLAEQMAFIHNPIFALDIFWRAIVVPVHLALYALPVVLVGYFLSLSARGRKLAQPWRISTELIFLVLSAAALLTGAKVLARPLVMPLIDWNLAAISSWPHPLSVCLTVILVFLSAWLCSAIVRRYRDPNRRPSGPAERLLDAFSLFLLVDQLLYVQFSDRYLLPLLPFVLIVVGRELWLDGPISRGHLRGALALTLATLMISTAWERDTLARGEALWSGGNWLLAKGVTPEQVHSESWEWEYYQGSFDRWLGSQVDPDKADFNDFFDRFWPEAWRNARYLVAVRGLTAPRQVAAPLLSIPYRDALLRHRFVDVVDRQAVTLTAGPGSAQRSPTR